MSDRDHPNPIYLLDSIIQDLGLTGRVLIDDSRDASISVVPVDERTLFELKLDGRWDQLQDRMSRAFDMRYYHYNPSEQ